MCTPKRILIVEDSITAQMMMEAQIHRREPDFSVHLRKSIKGCFEQLNETGADLVILDLGLTDTKGLETLPYIPLIKDHGCKVMVSTATLDDEINEGACLAAGADAFYPKLNADNATTLMSRIKALLPDDDVKTSACPA